MGRSISLAGPTRTISFGDRTADGYWTAVRLGGWDGSPASTLALTQRPRDIGAWPSEAFLGPKQGMTLSAMYVASSSAAAVRAMDAVNEALDIVEATLTVTDDGVAPRHMFVARQGDVIPTPQPNSRIKVFSAQLVAEDPRKYADDVSLGPLSVGSSVGGLSVPLTVPFTIPAIVTRGSLTFNLEGNVVAPCVLRIDGPTTGANVLHRWTYQGGGEETFATSLSIASGEYALLGPANDQFELMGQASRIGSVTQRAYVRLWPGPNYFTYNGTGGTLTVTGPQGAWQ